MRRNYLILFIALGLLATSALASEYQPQPPFAGFVEMPKRGELKVTPTFLYGAFQSYYQGTKETDISQGLNEYDVEYYSGHVLLEYGLTTNWAFDLTLGYVDQATRAFNPTFDVEKTSGLMDILFGVRYQVSRDSRRQNWVPDLTLRVGGIIPGSYDDMFPFAPGHGEVGIEPALFVRKEIWPGGGLYGGLGYRHFVTFAPDSVLISAGAFQRWRQFALMVGYRQQQALSGPDVGPPFNLQYSNRVKEMNYLAEWGATYTFRGGTVLRFFMNSNFDGRNAGEKLTFGGAVTFPFRLTR